MQQIFNTHMQPLLGNAFTYKLVPMATNLNATMEELLEVVFFCMVRAKGLLMRQV
jgi:uncharacterized protein YqgV (UPF0045/DUF77 family)